METNKKYYMVQPQYRDNDCSTSSSDSVDSGRNKHRCCIIYILCPLIKLSVVKCLKGIPRWQCSLCGDDYTAMRSINTRLKKNLQMPFPPTCYHLPLGNNLPDPYWCVTTKARISQALCISHFNQYSQKSSEKHNMVCCVTKTPAG